MLVGSDDAIWEGDIDMLDALFAIPFVLIFAGLAFATWKSAPSAVRKDLTQLLDPEQVSLDLDQGLLLEADLIRYRRVSTLVGSTLCCLAIAVQFTTDADMLGLVLVFSAFVIGRALTQAVQTALVRRRSAGELRLARLVDRGLERYLPHRALVMQWGFVGAVLATALSLILIGIAHGFTPDLVGAMLSSTSGTIALLAIVSEQRQLTRSRTPSTDPDGFLLHDLRIGIGVWDAHTDVGAVTLFALLMAFTPLVSNPILLLMAAVPVVAVIWWCSGTREAAVWHFRRSEQVPA